MRKGNAPKRYYIVHPGPLKTINLIGINGNIGTVPYINNKDNIYLNYGDSFNGDFIFKENLNLILDFEFIDQYGNSVTIESPSTLFNLKEVSQREILTLIALILFILLLKKLMNIIKWLFLLIKLANIK